MSAADAAAQNPMAPAVLDATSLFSGPGEMRALCRAFDWASTPLGPTETWSLSLRATVRMMLASRHPMFLWWGPELIQIYNDAYRPSFGTLGRHPSALGMRGFACWTDIWPVIGPQIEQVMTTGVATWHEDQFLPIERNGTLEDVWWTYSYSAAYDDDGTVGGTLVVCQETTSRMLARREELRLRAALDLERSRLAEAFRRSPSFLAVLRGERLVFELVNDAYEQLVGHRRDLVGKALADALPETRDQGFEALLNRVRETGEAVVLRDMPVLLRRTPDAPLEERFVDVTYLPIVEADGSRDAVIAHGSDITDRRLAAREREQLVTALAAEREQLRALMLSMPAPVALLLGPEHRHELVNEAFRNISGGGRDVTGLSVRDAFPELEGQGIYERLDHVYATGEAWSAPESLVRYDRDGDGIRDAWFDVQFEPVRDADGRVIGILNFAVDVTEQVLARREIEAARDAADADRARAEAVLSSITDAFYLLDRQWRFTYVNDAAEPLLQTTRGALLGRTLWDAFPGVIGSEFEGPYREAMATGRATVAEAHFAPLNTWFDVHTYPWSGGIMVHFRDIGPRKLAEVERERLLAETRAAWESADSANRSKSDFLAVMSHELRTPLNAIGGYAELMEMGIRGPVTAEQRHDLGRIQKSQRTLLGLINGVLNYAKLEAGAVDYVVEEVAMAEVLGACEVLVLPQARAKQLRLTNHCHEPQPVARADREKTQQVILNLLSNAIKFTDAGGSIELDCRTDGEQVVVDVRDSGRGIAPEQLDRIFQPFVQVDVALTRQGEGTGLGLAISRDLARAMGGDLTAASTLGSGSTFTLTLPAA